MKPSINPVLLLMRLHRPDGNPLRRRSDRLESMFVLVGLFLVVACVWPAVGAGRLAYEGAVHEEQAGSGPRHRVMATLLEDAPPARVSFTEVPAARPAAMARWTTPAGEHGSGLVPVPGLARAGNAVPVWLDAAGVPAAPPVDPVVLRMRGVAAGLLVMLGSVLLALVAYAGLRWGLDRRRLREWEAAWARAHQSRPDPRQP
ncbi:hypothetical protein [Nonomuraea sp. NPDC050643]|uniref:Rv1733c family protein n=1 Tax=Nonomuraea sp. NPDC050643 TaxID=3155660 RepID=UPI003400C2F3